MNKLWITLVVVLLFPRSVSAVDFSIKDPIVSNLEITVVASLSATSNYYLQGLLRSQSSSKYFGETQNNQSGWVDYISSPEKEYITSNFYLTEIKDATWSGTLKLRFKTDDPNYLGPGVYDLKLRRFTGNSSSSAGESNTLTINLAAAVPTPIPSPSPSPSPSPTPTPTSTQVPSSSPVGAESSRPLPSAQLSPPPVGSVAGESIEIDLSGFGVSPSPNPALDGLDKLSTKPSLNRSRAKTVILLGSGLTIISAASFFGYRKYLAAKGSDLKG